jgi:hypothetical protein
MGIVAPGGGVMQGFCMAMQDSADPQKARTPTPLPGTQIKERGV